MTSYADLVPGPTEQMFIAGQKGSGKTTLEKKFVDVLRRDNLIIIIDSKPEWDKSDLQPMLGRDPNKPHKLDLKLLWTLVANKNAVGVYVYQTNPEQPGYLDTGVSRIIYWALRRYDRTGGKKRGGRGLTIVIDEGGDFTTGTLSTPAMSKLLRQGRSKFVRIIYGAQRVSGIGTLPVDQAQRFCILMILNRNDRKKLAEWIHPQMLEPVSGHDFWYYEIPRDRAAKPITLMHQE